MSDGTPKTPNPSVKLVVFMGIIGHLAAIHVGMFIVTVGADLPAPWLVPAPAVLLQSRAMLHDG